MATSEDDLAANVPEDQVKVVGGDVKEGRVAAWLRRLRG